VAAVEFSRAARNHLKEIHDHIARDSPAAAEALIAEIISRVEQIVLFPESGRMIPESSETAKREILVGNYRVLYRLGSDPIWIVAIVHGRRLLPVRHLKS